MKSTALKTLGSLLTRQIKANVVLKDKLKELEAGRPVRQCNCVKNEQALIQRMIDLEGDVKYEVSLNSALKERIRRMEKYIEELRTINPSISERV